MYKKCLLAVAVATTVSLAACGGGGDSSPSSSAPPPAKHVVNGPLDAVQEPVSDQAIGALADAVAGTPLEGVVDCADVIVAGDVLDIADALALAASTAATTQNPAALAGAAADIQLLLGQLAGDLQSLLGALAGSGDCSGSAPGADPLAGNPLAGTPLEPVGAALLPVLAQILSQTGGGSGAGDLQLSTLAQLTSALNSAAQGGLAQIPAEAWAAPVVGGALISVRTALQDLNLLVAAASVYNATATEARLATLVDHTLVNLLTQVVPVAFIEQQAGQPGLVSSQIRSASQQLAVTLAGALGTATQPAMEQALSGALQPVLDPIENQVLPAVIGPIIDALSGGLPTVGTGPTGTPLDPVLATLSETLSGALGGLGLPCVFAGTPLAALCTLL